MRNIPKWQLTPGAAWRFFFAIIFVLVSCYISRAQEPPPEPTPPAQPVIRSAAVQTALEVINARNPETPVALMEAVIIMERLGAFDDARGFLDRLIATDPDAETMAKVHEAIGAAPLVRLANDEAMMPEAREFVHKLFAAKTELLRSPERINRLIATLGDKDAETRRVAAAELAKVGAHAVPFLFDAMRNAPKDVPFDELSKAVIRIGPSAEEPLIAGLTGSDNFLQGISAMLLGHVGRNRAQMHLIRPYLVGKENVQTSASYALRKLGGSYPSSVNESASMLARIATRHLEGESPLQPEYDDTLEMWTWNAERNNVVANRLTKREAAAIAAARAARDAYELSPTFENTQLLLVSRLQVDQLLNGVDKLLPQGIGTAYQFGSSAGANAVCNALDYCLKNELDPAAIGAAELLGDLCVRAVGTGNYWTPLTRALQSPNRRVRYAACRAIMKIDPRYAFTGSSFMMEALIDLAEASGVPGAIVATPRTEVSANLTGLMSSIGFSVFTTNDGRPCLKEAMRSSDYDVILLSDSVNNPMADETIQQLRKSPKTRRIPVILLAREGIRTRTELMASQHNNVVVMPEFGDEATLTERLQEVEIMVADNSVTPSRRLEQAKDAIDWMAHLAQYSKTYPWYDTMRAREVALKAVAQPTLASSAIGLLGYLGDDSAQRILVDLASQPSLSIEDRQRAANSFGESVLRRGLMLRKAEVDLQYDRYNASENENKNIQEVLGQLLDVIETQTRPTSLQQP